MTFVWAERGLRFRVVGVDSFHETEDNHALEPYLVCEVIGQTRNKKLDDLGKKIQASMVAQGKCVLPASKVVEFMLRTRRRKIYSAFPPGFLGC